MRYTFKRELIELIKKRNYPIEKAKRLLNFVFHIMYLPKNLDKKITDYIYEQYLDVMATTQLPPEAKKRAEVFFEVFIEKTTGKSYEEYLEEQKKMRIQITEFKKQIKKAEEEKMKVEQEKQLLEQKAAEEKRKAKQEKQLLEQKATEEKKKVEQEKLKVEQEKQLLEQKVAEEKRKVEQEKLKVEQEKLLLEQKAAEEKRKVEQEKQLLEQKAAEEKLKVEQEKKDFIYELSKMLQPSQIATAVKMEVEEVVKIISEYKANKKD